MKAIGAVLLSMVFAFAAAAVEPVAIELGPKDSLAPVPGTGVVLFAFSTEGMHDLRFSHDGTRDESFAIASVPEGVQLQVWRVPAGKFCLTRYYAGGGMKVPNRDELRCFTVVDGAVNNSGIFSTLNFGGWVQLTFIVKLEGLIAILEEKRPDLLQPGIRWHLGRQDATGSKAAKLRAFEADARDYGLADAAEARENPNSPLGLRQLGDAFRSGENTAVDRPKAFNYYLRAADLKDARAAALVCQQLDLGLGVPEDQKRAVEYCQKGADRGDELAAWLLSRLYARGRGGLKPDPAIQAALVSKVTDQAELAHVVIQQSWGSKDGAGNWPDGAEVFRVAQVWYDSGDHDAAAYALANYYANGIGVAINGARAIELFELSAQQSTSNEYKRIADIYWAGKAVPRDLFKARDYLERHADLGGDNADELAWFLAIAEDPKVRNGKRAAKLQLKVLDSYKRTAARVDTLAAAYAAAGKFEQAVATQSEAIELAKKETWSEAGMAKFNARLELYKSGKPYTQAEP